jgi:hypothetical protein
MLDGQLNQLRLIDLDYLDNDGDYIKDFALLIEDVCVFRFLFDEGYRFYLGKGSGRFVSYSTEPKLIENKIEYPPFSSEATRLFQQQLLQHLELYAHRINDETWQERLWLALATYLLFLVTKQTEKGYATIVYVEAVKLLDELVAHLDNESVLNEIPFPGKHPAGVEADLDHGAPRMPAWHRTDPVLAGLHDGVMALDPTIKCELTSSDRVAQYFAANPQRPFAVVDGKKRPASLLLACTLPALADPHGLAQARQTSSAFQIIVQISAENDTSPTLKLIQQAFELNR